MILKLAVASILLVGLVSCSTSPKPSDSTDNTTATSHAADNTSKAPNTTEPSNSTTPTPSNITTVAPTNHTTVAPTNGTTVAPTNGTTPKPTPEPSTSVKFFVKDSKNNTCILMKGEFTMMIDFTDKMNKSQKLSMKILANSTVDGTCGDEKTPSEMTITYYEDFTLKITISLDSDKDFSWTEVETTVNFDDVVFQNLNISKPNGTQTFTQTGNFFKASQQGSYMCNSDTTTGLNNTSLETKDFQYAAFQSNIKDFSTNNVQECSADAKTNSIVPIAVGAALAGLVVIVLIAYLIGRRRNRKGYESV